MIIIGLCGVLVLALIAAVVIIRSRGGATVARSAEEAVEKYLEAVADNRSADAIALLADPPSERSMLTDAMLQAAHRDNPMDDIDVHEMTAGHRGEGTAVVASYDLGEEYQAERLSAVETEDGWRVTNGTTPLRVASGSGALPDLKLNGIKITSFEPVLFPGIYRAELTSDNLRLAADQQQVKIGAPYDVESFEQLTYEITPAGHDAARAAVEQAALACIAKHDYIPGCGLGIKDKLETGATVQRESIRWRLRGTARHELKIMTFEISADNPTMAESSSYVPVELTATCVDQSRSFECTGDQTLGRPQVDLAADPITVGWLT